MNYNEDAEKYRVTNEIYLSAVLPYLNGEISLNKLKRLLALSGLSKHKCTRLANRLWNDTHPDVEAQIRQHIMSMYNRHYML